LRRFGTRSGSIALDEFVARDYIDGNPVPGQAAGLEGAKQKWAMYFAGIPDLSANIEDLVAGGDRVVIRFTAEGTHQGTLLGVPPTGKRLWVTAISIYRLVEGKIVEHWEEGDRLGLLQQLGVIPGTTRATATP
jgi:predicted ester cyclase